MKRKQWLLLVLCILLLAGYFKFFYKTWSNHAVSQKADCVVALDVKRITNTLIWDFITSPSRWKSISFFSSKKELSWEDMIELPDYVFLFHNKGEPMNIWYTVLQIKDERDFENGLKQFHFEKRGPNEYFNDKAGIGLVRNGKQLLVSNTAVNNEALLQQTAAALFSKQFIEKDKLQQLVNKKSHVALQVFSSSFNQYISAAQLNFDKNSLSATASIVLPDAVSWPAGKFNYCDTSMCVIGCMQPQPGMQKLLNSNLRAAVSKAVNFNIDSFFVNTNSSYKLDIEGIHTRIDSAVSYTYDDNFNPVEKKVVNSIEEPAYNFWMIGGGAGNVFRYWLAAGKLESSPEGNLFTPVPFVKSYCLITSSGSLLVTSNNYLPAAENHSVEAVAFFHLLLTKIPASLMKYMPAAFIKAIGNIEKVQASLTGKNKEMILQINCSKKKNDLPLFNVDL